MKKLSSFLSVATLALVFGAGCKKLENCNAAKEEAPCINPASFDPQVGCMWDAAKAEGKKCDALVDAATDAICNPAADKAACDTASAKAKTAGAALTPSAARACFFTDKSKCISVVVK